MEVQKSFLFYQSSNCKFKFGVYEDDTLGDDYYTSNELSCEDGSYSIDFEIASHDCVGLDYSFYTCVNALLRLHYSIYDALGEDSTT